MNTKHKIDERVVRLVKALGELPATRRELLDILGLKQSSRRNFRTNYFNPAADKGYVKMLMPHIPSCPEQAYRLTDRGMAFLKELKAAESKKDHAADKTE